MQLFHSYSQAFQYAMEEKTYSVAHLFQLKKDLSIDTSGCYKIFFCVSGSKNFQISDIRYSCDRGDLFLILPQDWHYFTDYSAEESHERYIFFVHPQFFSRYNSAQTELNGCFLSTCSRGSHKLKLSGKEQLLVHSCIQKLTESPGFGQDVLCLAYFLEFLVLLNRMADTRGEAVTLLQNPYPERIMQIQAFLHANITGNLSGQLLQAQFSLSYAHLNRIFKSATGLTLYQYIRTQRIVLAKELLSQGRTVTEACFACGFNDLSNFIKAFTQAVGCTPKKYAQLL